MNIKYRIQQYLQRTYPLWIGIVIIIGSYVAASYFAFKFLTELEGLFK